MARNVSPITLTIRELLEKNKGNITYSEALPLLQKIDPSFEDSKGSVNHFNVTKSLWKKSTNPTVSQKPSRNKIAKNAKVVKAAKVVSKAKFSNEQFSAARKIIELGGMKFVQKRMTQLNAELQELQLLVDSALSVQKALVA